MNDSHCVLLEYFDIIHNSPSQIYHSALLFSPPSSWLHRYYSGELSQEVRVVRGLPVKWGECLCTLSLDLSPWNVTCWKDIIAVGCFDESIIVLDGITGSQKAVLSAESDYVRSVTFSSDGTSLVSGGGDYTVKLWDVQTGGVVKTFDGHTDDVFSVSISVDCTMIASGSEDKTIRLWDVQLGECLHVMGQQERVYHVSFSPTDPQYLISASGGKLWQWDISSCKINPVHDSSHVTFSLDQVKLVLCKGVVVVVQHLSHRQLSGCCCLIPGGRLIAVAIGSTINIWDITSSEPHLIKTYVGHTKDITSLAFSSPSSLISSSYDQSVKFWQIGDLLADLSVTDQKSTPLASAPIQCIALQAKDDIALSCDSNGMVRIWDTLTGHCKASFQTPAKEPKYADVQLINSRLTCVWCGELGVHIWDTEKKELKIVGRNWNVQDVKISGDGSRVYCLYNTSLQALSVLTGEDMGEVGLEYSPQYQRSLTVDGLRVWVHSPVEKLQGWDFGILGPSPVQLDTIPPAHLNGTKLWDSRLSGLQNPATGKVFQLGRRFVKPAHVQWDGQFLVAGYDSGEVLILDFSHVLF